MRLQVVRRVANRAGLFLIMVPHSGVVALERGPVLRYGDSAPKWAVAAAVLRFVWLDKHGRVLYESAPRAAPASSPHTLVSTRPAAPKRKRNAR